MTSYNLQCKMYFHAEVNSQTKRKIYLGFGAKTFCIACVQYRAFFWEFSNVHPWIYNKFHTKGRGAPKSAGPVAIATFATILNPALTPGLV